MRFYGVRAGLYLWYNNPKEDMEYVRLKYANNKLISSDIKEHREVIDEYVSKKGYEYIGFIPVLFGQNGKIMEVDLIFKKEKKAEEEKKK